MKWFTHKTLAVAGALALNAPATGIAATFIGSILPDVTEKAMSMGSMQVWGKIHRQAAHWFGWYLLLVIIGTTIVIPQESPADQSTKVFLEAITWLGFGGISHIVLDALTPKGVPLWPLGGKKRIGFPLVTTGSFGEFVFLIFILLFLAYQVNQSPEVITEIVEKTQAIINTSELNKLFGH